MNEQHQTKVLKGVCLGWDWKASHPGVLSASNKKHVWQTRCLSKRACFLKYFQSLFKASQSRAMIVTNVESR